MEYFMKKEFFLVQFMKILLGTTVIIFLGVLLPSFYWLCIGIIFSIFVIINTFYNIFNKNYESEDYIWEEIDFCATFFIGFYFTILYWIFCGDRYISSEDNKQHLYRDCIIINNDKDIQDVIKMKGFFYGKFFDCKECMERKKTDEKEKELELLKEQIEEEMRDKLEMEDEFLNAIIRLRTGESPDTVATDVAIFLYNEGYGDVFEEEDEEDSFLREKP